MFRAILCATAVLAAVGDEAGLRGLGSEGAASQQVNEQSDVERLVPAAVEKVTILQDQGYGQQAGGYGQQAGAYGQQPGYGQQQGYGYSNGQQQSGFHQQIGNTLSGGLVGALLALVFVVCLCCCLCQICSGMCCGNDGYGGYGSGSMMAAGGAGFLGGMALEEMMDGNKGGPYGGPMY